MSGDQQDPRVDIPRDFDDAVQIVENWTRAWPPAPKRAIAAVLDAARPASPAPEHGNLRDLGLVDAEEVGIGPAPEHATPDVEAHLRAAFTTAECVWDPVAPPDGRWRRAYFGESGRLAEVALAALPAPALAPWVIRGHDVMDLPYGAVFVPCTSDGTPHEAVEVFMTGDISVETFEEIEASDQRYRVLWPIPAPAAPDREPEPLLTDDECAALAEELHRVDCGCSEFGDPWGDEDDRYIRAAMAASRARGKARADRITSSTGEDVRGHPYDVAGHLPGGDQ